MVHAYRRVGGPYVSIWLQEMQLEHVEMRREDEQEEKRRRRDNETKISDDEEDTYLPRYLDTYRAADRRE